MISLVLGRKRYKDMDLAFKDFIVVKEETKIKTSIKTPPGICKKNESRFRI